MARLHLYKVPNQAGLTCVIRSQEMVIIEDVTEEPKRAMGHVLFLDLSTSHSGRFTLVKFIALHTYDSYTFLYTYIWQLRDLKINFKN